MREELSWRTASLLILNKPYMPTPKPISQRSKNLPGFCPLSWDFHVQHNAYFCHGCRTEGKTVLAVTTVWTWGWSNNRLYLPFLQTEKLTCCSFMDVDRRHKDPRSRTKDSLTYCTSTEASKVSALPCTISPRPSSQRATQRGPVSSVHLVVYIIRGTEFREPKSFKIGSKPAYPLLKRGTLPSKAVCTPALCSRRQTLSAKIVQLYKTPLKW